MSLVADYGSSDSEGSDVEAPIITKKNKGLSLPPPKNISGNKLDLPAPKNKSVVYVDLPAAVRNHSDNDDDDDEEAKERKAKRARLNNHSLGLADLLPAPKNTNKAPPPVTQKATDAAFMPLALARKLKKGKEKASEDLTQKTDVQEQGKEKKENEEKQVEEEEEDRQEEQEELPKQHTGSFFRIGKELKDDPIKPTVKKNVIKAPSYPVEPVQEETQEYYDPNALYSFETDPSTYQYHYEQYQQYEEQSVGDYKGDEQFEKLVGKRMKGESNIQFKTVNQQDMLPSDEWRKTQSLTAAPKFNTGAPMVASKLQLKKNNIFALAAQAVNNQEKLDQQFAANRRTKREAANKYGF